MGKRRAQGLEHSGYLRNSSYYFMVISQKPAGCPCPPQEVWLNLVQENPDLCLLFWPVPTRCFSGFAETSFLSRRDVLPGTRPDPSVQKNPLEGCPIKKLKTACPVPS